MLYRYLWRCLLSWHRSKSGFVSTCIGEVSLGRLDNTHHKKLASKVTKELVTIWCITEWVKRLVGNEIELGIEIPTIESRTSTIPTDRGNQVCCHYGSTDKDLRRICRSQHGYPDHDVGYWPERCLGHVYMVPEPVGSTHLRFGDARVVMEIVCVYRMLFGVPDEIPYVTRSLRMVER